MVTKMPSEHEMRQTCGMQWPQTSSHPELGLVPSLARVSGLLVTVVGHLLPMSFTTTGPRAFLDPLVYGLEYCMDPSTQSASG